MLLFVHHAWTKTVSAYMIAETVCNIIFEKIFQPFAYISNSHTIVGVSTFILFAVKSTEISRISPTPSTTY